MKSGYTVVNVIASTLHKAILVSNYYHSNEVVNLPVIKGSKLLVKSDNNAGAWKIKKLK